MDEAVARRRIEAAGLKLPPAREEEILAAAPLVRRMVDRVHRNYAYTDEPAVVAQVQAVRK